MTVEVNLAEFLNAFVAEVDEHLAVATTELLEIDAAARKGERAPRAVRKLFRAMHTIKGLSSMVGVEPIVTVAHRLETMLRDADRSAGALLPGAADAMLQSVRFVEGIVRTVERGAKPVEPPTALLAALDAAGSTEVQLPDAGTARLTLEPALEEKLDTFERDLLLKGHAEGRRALRLDYAPTAERAATGFNINTVRDRVGSIADIIRVIPMSIPATAASSAGIAFALLLLTSSTDEQLALAAGVDRGALQSIVEVDAPGSARAPLIPHTDELAPDSDQPLDDAPRRSLLRVDAARVDDAIERLATLVVTRSRLGRAIATLTAAGADTRELVLVAKENARQLRDLRASILQVRMVPITDVLDRIPLMLRALLRSSDRQAKLEVEAGGAELDKAVAERIFPAIMHLVRNAVDHGIEPPQGRAKAGKPAEGTIRIACSARSSTRLELTIEDDGRGVDASAVAARLGVPTPETDAALLELLCQPGFSTRDAVTTTSGRGLGMDIVKRICVEQLGGELAMSTRPGLGTRFALQVPLSVAIIDAFVIECAEQRFVVPVSVVEEILEIDPDVAMAPPDGVGGAPSTRPVGLLERRGEVLPLFALATVLGLTRQRARERRAIVIRRAGEAVGFLFERVTGQQEAVIRPLVDPLVHVAGIAAATDLGDGKPTLVLDPIALLGRGSRRGKELEGSSHAALPPLGGTVARSAS